MTSVITAAQDLRTDREPRRAQTAMSPHGREAATQDEHGQSSGQRPSEKARIRAPR